MGMLDFLTGGKSSEANNDLEQALQTIQSVHAPTADEMKFQLQKLVSAGTLTPEKAQFYLANPSAYQTEVIPQLGTQAQEDTIAGLQSAAKNGGETATMEAGTQDVIRKLNTQEKGQRDAILQNAASRGTLTGGETLAAQLEGNQADEANANQTALSNRATAEQLALQELTSAGTAGNALQGQENTQANTVSGAIDAINKFNASQEQSTEDFNVGNENSARAANLENAQNISNTNVGNENTHALQQSQLPQEVYQDALQKAEAEAGINDKQSKTATGQGNQLLNIEGGIASAVSPGLGSAFKGFMAPAPPAPGAVAADTAASGADTAVLAASEGGEIHNYLNGGLVRADKPGERAVVPGNSPKNDRIPANVSDGEIVLPRTVAAPAMNGNNDKVMQFLNRMRQSKRPAPPPPVHPHDVKSVLDAMALRRAS